MRLPPFAPENLALALRTVGLPDMQVGDESLMVERIVIDRPTGTEIDDGGREQTTYRQIYDGIGLLTSFRPYEQNADVGGSTATMQRVDWHIPALDRIPALLNAGKVTQWDGPVLAGDRARRMTEGKPVKTVRIAGEHDITWAVSQRFVVDDITGGAWA
ncbi:MAG: hypothetical protein Q4F65_05665 [Propionibacteriaceae bacterium]|nr:hypothetical protein [Propionibacteriaceae bacterium]